MKKAIFTAATAAFVLAPMALADDHADKFTMMDANGDAAVTEAEFVTYATATGEVTDGEASLQFAVLAGRDGVLTREEFDAAMSVKEDAAVDRDTADISGMDSADPAETEGE